MLFQSVLGLGCAVLPESSPEPFQVELRDEKFPDIVLSIDPRLLRPLQFGEELKYHFTITNHRAQTIEVEYARLRLSAVKLDTKRTPFSYTEKIQTQLAQGESLDLSQYLYFGFDRLPSTVPESKQLTQWLGEEAGGHTASGSLDAGDALIGILLGLKIDGQPNYDIYVAKYHFDVSDNTILPYYFLPTEKANSSAQIAP